jgi:hypothetical protein
MSPKKKLAYRDRSVRHAFIYINILKTELGLNFEEIAVQLNVDNYRTREGEKYRRMIKLYLDIDGVLLTGSQLPAKNCNEFLEY